MTHDVNRWHAHKFQELRESGDSVRKHQFRVETICHDIAGSIPSYSYSAMLAKAARNHDMPELIMGDWPATLTRDYFIARWAKCILEWQIKRKMGLHWRLTGQEKLILALADKLDAYEWAKAHCKPEQMAEFEGDLAAIWRMADRLGPEVGNWLHGRLV